MKVEFSLPLALKQYRHQTLMFTISEYGEAELQDKTVQCVGTNRHPLGAAGRPQFGC